ncbi:MAG: hypothetical protein K2W82_14290 [Candidatus Obscuribacterales bacterium]|nr:hypothetical protein [Candidatus Obscuribacterales bacterium]
MKPVEEDVAAERARQRLIAKIQRDPYYGPAYEKLGTIEAMFNAGYFDDGELIGDMELPRAGIDWLMTPVHKICKRLDDPKIVQPGQRLAVLVMTGAFCPIHIGHVESMEIAKKELESRGFAVLGGYFSPSHDRYVSVKCKEFALSAMHRLHLCNLTVAPSDWLMADGWEALGVDRAINFSDVLFRLEQYLAKHVQSSLPIELFYVFSSDHARFSHAFIGRGGCVCTLRPDHRVTFEQYANDPHVQGNPNIIFARQERKIVSSFSVLHGDFHMMEEKAGETFQQWLMQQNSAKASEVVLASKYSLRNEESWSLSPWLTRHKLKELQAEADKWLHELSKALKSAHINAKQPDSPRKISFRISRLSKQKKQAAESLGKHKVISLDGCIHGTFDLSISRLFSLCAPSVKAEIGASPFSPPLIEQVSKIPPGEYILFDDDIATGTTMNEVRKLLPKRVKVKRQFALTVLQGDKKVSFLDILDCRDFLAGSREGGLVVKMPDGSLARVPYCLPYCSPADRASVPISQELEFSQEIWRFNERFFNNVKPSILLQEADPAFQQIMLYVGFELHTPMSFICRWHAEQLALTIARTTVP